jgi:dynein heavy chain
VEVEDFDVAMKAYVWPKKMVEVMKEAVSKANAEHKEFEHQLKKRRLVFSDTLVEYERSVGLLEERDEMNRRDALAKEVTGLSEKLRAADEEAEDINTQEKLFGWAATKYQHIKKLIQRLDPYYTLWTTAAEFQDNHSAWMNGPFIKLDPEEVEATVSESFRKIYKLTKVFAGGVGSERAEKPLHVAEQVHLPVHPPIATCCGELGGETLIMCVVC